MQPIATELQFTCAHVAQVNTPFNSLQIKFLPNVNGNLALTLRSPIRSTCVGPRLAPHAVLVSWSRLAYRLPFWVTFLRTSVPSARVLMMIKGSLKEYPIPLLLEIFKYRNETGLLQISSASNAGQFYFKEGKLVDAVLNNAAGTEALRCAEALTDGAFEFNSVGPAEYARLVWQNTLKPSHSTDRANGFRSIFSARVRDLLTKTATGSRNLCRTVTSASETLLCWGSMTLKLQQQAARTFMAAFDNGIAARFQEWWRWAKATKSNLNAHLKPQLSLSVSKAKEQLNSLVSQLNVGFSVLVLIAVAALATTLILKGRWIVPLAGQNQISDAAHATTTAGTVLTAGSDAVVKQTAEADNKPQATNSGATKNSASPTKETNAHKANLKSSKQNSAASSASLAPAIRSTEKSATAEQTISVLVRIEGGHVSDASVLEPRAGLERYEAAALRIARQRRYTGSTKPYEIVTLKVKNP